MVKSNAKEVKKSETKESDCCLKNFDIKKFVNSPYLFLVIAVIVIVSVIVVAIVTEPSANPDDKNISNNLTDNNLEITEELKITYYFDFQCPWCSYFAHNILTSVLETYGSNVIVELKPVAFLDRQNPDKESHNAANGYFCAVDQGKGFEFAMYLEEVSYKHYFEEKKGENEGLYSKENVFNYAKEISGLDYEKFSECYNSNIHSADLEVNISDFSAAGGTGTPFVLLNNQKVNAQNLELEIKKVLGEGSATLNLTTIYPKECVSCAELSNALNSALEQNLGYTVKNLVLEPNTKESKDLESKYNIEFYPAIFLETDNNMFSEIFFNIDENLYGMYDAPTYYMSGIYRQGLIPQYYKTIPDFSTLDGLGDGNLIVMEFSDYMCPYCARFDDDIFPQFKKNFIDTNKVKYIYLQMPLEGLHPGTSKVSEAALCAKDQNKFWEYHDLLFVNNIEMYSEIANLDENSKTQENYLALFSKYFNNSALLSIADKLELNKEIFTDCLDSNAKELEVSADTDFAQSLLISGTPSFLIGNQFVAVGSYDDLEKAINLVLEYK